MRASKQLGGCSHLLSLVPRFLSGKLRVRDREFSLLYAAASARTLGEVKDRLRCAECLSRG